MRAGNNPGPGGPIGNIILVQGITIDLVTNNPDKWSNHIH